MDDNMGILQLVVNGATTVLFAFNTKLFNVDNMQLAKAFFTSGAAYPIENRVANEMNPNYYEGAGYEDWRYNNRRRTDNDYNTPNNSNANPPYFYQGGYRSSRYSDRHDGRHSDRHSDDRHSDNQSCARRLDGECDKRYKKGAAESSKIII